MVARNKKQRSGSIYVLTLLTVAAVGSMVLIGVTIRNASSVESGLIETVNKNSSGVLDAAEYAIGHINNDPNWTNNAQKGQVFSEFTLGDRTYSSSVVDADTLVAPTLASSNYRVTVTSTTGLAVDSASVDLRHAKIDYLGYLQSLGLDAYWPLNEATGSTTANDPQDGRDGRYLDPDAAGAGTNDEGGTVPVFANSGDHIETPYDSNYQDDTQGTVSFWMKNTGTGPYTSYGVFGQRFQSNAMPAVAMTCMGGSLSAYMNDSGAFSQNSSSITPFGLIKIGQWHHVAMTWGPSGLRIYIDGVQQASRNVTVWDTRDGSLGEQPLHIGASYIPASSSQPQVGFEGSIAHFAILSSELDASKIAEIAAIKPDEIHLTLIEDSWVKVFD